MDEIELVEKARCKINLGLKVLRRREDGFHEISSIAQSVDLADTLQFRRSPAPGLTCTDPTLPVGADNLVLRAAALFNARLPQSPQAWHIHLEKQIPVGAGLGGGSADAAAVLRGLNRLNGNPFAAVELHALAAQLGSDVPFQVVGGTALMQGRGERLEGLAWRGEVFYVLVYPEVEVSSAWAYGRVGVGLTPESPYLKFTNSLKIKSGGCVDHALLFRVLENDFLPLIERTYPIVAQLRAVLEATGALACSMSGSGSTVYGVFDDRTAAYQAQQRLQAKGYRSFLCRPDLRSPGR